MTKWAAGKTALSRSGGVKGQNTISIDADTTKPARGGLIRAELTASNTTSEEPTRCHAPCGSGGINRSASSHHQTEGNYMFITRLARAAQQADQIIYSIVDNLSGNAARRRTIKQRLMVAMLATERHSIVAARAANKLTAKAPKMAALLHWRAELHRKAA